MSVETYSAAACRDRLAAISRMFRCLPEKSAKFKPSGSAPFEANRGDSYCMDCAKDGGTVSGGNCAGFQRRLILAPAKRNRTEAAHGIEIVSQGAVVMELDAAAEG